MSLGYLAMPVVHLSPTQHWSGFGPTAWAASPLPDVTPHRKDTSMHTHAVLDDSPEHLDELDHLERIGEIRSQLLGHIAEGIPAMQRAAQALEQLRSNSIYDAEFVDGRDGGDVVDLP